MSKVHGSNKVASKKIMVPLGPTDSDLDKTYTGLDRELAEEFIEQTMDPAIVLERSLVLRSPNKDVVNNNNNNNTTTATTLSITESEAW